MTETCTWAFQERDWDLGQYFRKFLSWSSDKLEKMAELTNILVKKTYESADFRSFLLEKLR